MKKTILKIVIVVVVIIGINIAITPIINRYTKPCTVWCRDGWDIIVEDNTGNLWQFEDRERYNLYCKGDKVMVTFDCNQTDGDITDDIIVRTALMK